MRDRVSSSASLANSVSGTETDNENLSEEQLNLFGDDYYNEAGSSSRKRRRISLSVDPSDGDRCVLGRSWGILHRGLIGALLGRLCSTSDNDS